MTDFNVTIVTEEGARTVRAPSGTILADLIASVGHAVHADCGRRGICKKCAVKIISGKVENAVPDENGNVLSCLAGVCSDLIVSTRLSAGTGLTDFDVSDMKYNAPGIAVDIGTTTIAAAYVCPGKKPQYLSALNPQSAYGADVISRIKSASDGALTELTSVIRKAVNDLISRFDITEKPCELVIAGNTTMQHLFCGVSPEKLGVYPFTPEFTDAVFFKGEDLGFDMEKATVLPSVSAFVGADIVSGIYALCLHKSKGISFLADLGTNGEMVLSDKGKLFCTSSAAGPALEGACIECGCGGVAGAINRIYESDGRLCFTTIGNEKAVGICGAGIVDALAYLINKEYIDCTGYFENEKLSVTDDLYISQKDIRQYQLAKSAVCSSIQTLLLKTGKTVGDIEKFYIAGGLGYYIDIDNAFLSGLLPKMPKKKVSCAGNSSLMGAVRCIGDPSAVEEMRKIARECVNIELGGDMDFSMKFTDNMYFDC